MALSEHRHGALAEFDQALGTQDSSFVYRLLPAPPVRAPGPWSAPSTWLCVSYQLGLAGLAIFVATVVALHGLRGDLNPAEHTVSEYSLGAYGWLMRAAFAALGCGVLATAASLRLGFEPTSAWRVGLLLLVLTAIGLFLDAGYNTDHPRVPETPDGTVHGIGMLMVCLALPAASLVFGSVLAQNSESAQARWLKFLAAGQLVANFGFDMSPTAVRGLIERIAIALAIATLVLLPSAARSHTGSSGTTERALRQSWEGRSET